MSISILDESTLNCLYKDLFESCGLICKGKVNINISRCTVIINNGIAYNNELKKYLECNPAAAHSSKYFDFNAVDSDGWSCLHHASGSGSLPLVKYLTSLQLNTGEYGNTITYYINIDLQATDKCTPLWIAAFNGHRDIVQVTLD